MLETTAIHSLSYLDYFAIFASAFAASFLSGIGGFGGAFIVALVLTPLIGVKSLVPLIAVFAFASNLSRISFYFRTINWRLALQFFLSSIPGVFIGTSFFKWLPEKPLQILFGLVLISAIPVRRYLKSRKFKPGLKTILSFGFIYGCVSGTAVGAGMFVVAGLLGMGLQGPLLLGTDAVIGLLNSSTRMIAFRYHDLLPNDLIVAGLLMGITTAPGTWLASKIVKRTAHSTHSVLVEVLIVLGGVVMLFGAFG